MVVTAHPLATRVGLDILAAGGNIVDAVIGVHFALAVVYPSAGNLGGGGFAMLRNWKGGVFALDFREKASRNATRNMYLGPTGEPLESLSKLGILSCGVPGSVAGMKILHDRFGSLPWSDLLMPSVALAAEGFLLTAKEACKLNENKEIILF